MRHRLHGFAGALCILAGVSCDPGFDFRGRIADTADKPIVGAKANLVCDGLVQFGATTDVEGRFSRTAIGWRPNTCTIDMEAPLRRPLRFSVKDHCAKLYREDACLGVWIDVVMPELP